MSIQKFCYDDVFILSEKLNTGKYAAVLPTDTVIGIISHNKDLIYKIKNRPLEKKLVLLVPNANCIRNLLPKEKEAINKYWPGSLTIVKDKIAYRMPNHKDLLTLLEFTGPIYSSSANISGKEPIKNTLDAQSVFSQNIDSLLIVKGEALSDTPSTIVDLDEKKVLRNGKIDGNKIIKEICHQ